MAAAAEECNPLKEIKEANTTFATRLLIVLPDEIVNRIYIIAGDIWLLTSRYIVIRSVTNGEVITQIDLAGDCQYSGMICQGATLTKEGYVLVSTNIGLYQVDLDGSNVVCVDDDDPDANDCNDVVSDDETVYVIVTEDEYCMFLRSYVYENGKYVRKTNVEFEGVSSHTVENLHSLALFEGTIFHVISNRHEIDMLPRPKLSINGVTITQLDWPLNVVCQFHGSYTLILSKAMIAANWSEDDPLTTTEKVKLKMEIHNVNPSVYSPGFPIKLTRRPDNVLACTIDQNRNFYMVGTLAKNQRRKGVWGLYKCSPRHIIPRV